jgi:hypothetical protein
MDYTNKSYLNRIFGGVNMSWPFVIICAVIAAAATALFLIVPAFASTSLQRVGETLEAWFLFAIFIMANCKSPLESALKTFVFFLISQPLIYLFQVPFSSMGWGIFGYYKYWAILTAATLPMAYVGWYITKKNWLSVLILLPVIAFLAMTGYEGFRDAFTSFPRHLGVGIFCLASIILYMAAFFPDLRSKLLGIAVTIAVCVFMFIRTPQVNVQTTQPLPETPAISEDASVTTENAEIARPQVWSEDGTSYAYIFSQKYGTTVITVTDGSNVYRYNVRVYNEGGTAMIEITKAE